MSGLEGDDYQDSGLQSPADLAAHPPAGGEQQHGVDEELRVDEEVADEDGAGRQHPAVQPDHQHRGHVQPAHSDQTVARCCRDRRVPQFGH